MPQHCSAFICPSPNGLPSRHIHFLRKQPLNVTGIPKDDFHLTCCCCINQRYPVASITTGQEAGSRFSQNWFVIFGIFSSKLWRRGEKKKSCPCVGGSPEELLGYECGLFAHVSGRENGWGPQRAKPRWLTSRSWPRLSKTNKRNLI